MCNVIRRLSVCGLFFFTSLSASQNLVFSQESVEAISGSEQLIDSGNRWQVLENPADDGLRDFMWRRYYLNTLPSSHAKTGDPRSRPFTVDPKTGGRVYPTQGIPWPGIPYQTGDPNVGGAALGPSNQGVTWPWIQQHYPGNPKWGEKVLSPANSNKGEPWPGNQFHTGDPKNGGTVVGPAPSGQGVPWPLNPYHTNSPRTGGGVLVAPFATKPRILWPGSTMAKTVGNTETGFFANQETTKQNDQVAVIVLPSSPSRETVLNDLWEIVHMIDSDIDRSTVEKRAKDRSMDEYTAALLALKSRVKTLLDETKQRNAVQE